MAKVHPIDAALADRLAEGLPLLLNAEMYRTFRQGSGMSRGDIRRAVGVLVADGRAVVTAGSFGLIVAAPDKEGT